MLKKRVLTVIILSVVLLITILGVNHWLVSRIAKNDLAMMGEQIVHTTIHQLNGIIRSAERAPNTLQVILSGTDDNSKNNLYALIRTIVLNDKEIYGSTIAFEPYAYDPNLRYYAPYYYEKNNGLALKMLGDEKTYDYHNLDWYKNAKLQNAPVWSEPYFDKEGGEVYMVTYSAPFYKNIDGKNVFQGVVTADVSLDWLDKAMTEEKLPHNGYLFLVSKNGAIITFPAKGVAMKDTLSALADKQDSTALRQAAKDLTAGKPGAVLIKDFVSGTPAWMFYSPLAKSGWSVCMVFDRSMVLAGVRMLTVTMIFLGLAGIGIALFIFRHVKGNTSIT